MTMTDQQPGVARVLGGESGHRGLLGFGGPRAIGRVVGIAVPVAFAIIGTIIFGLPALVGGLSVALVVYIVTIETRHGSVFSRNRRSRRWRSRLRLGTDVYVPYSPEAWERAQADLAAAGMRDRRAAQRAVNAIRAMPDGADGLGWLQSDWRRPGITWQAPLGEEDRLTVTFAVPGQLRGMQSAGHVGSNAELYGQFLASHAGDGLLRQVQPLARLLPVDTALYEDWIRERVDEGTPDGVLRSYDQAIRRTGAAAMTQRHFLTCTWPLSAQFYDRARRYGEGREGWRVLMSKEIENVENDLAALGMGGARALTARELAATMLHMQNPSRPIDYLSDADPSRLGLPSRDLWSANVVSGIDPVTGEHVTWWHRTARIDPAAMSHAARTPLWHLPLMLGSTSTVVRSVSFNLELVPAEVARGRTKQDVTNDMATKIAKAGKGEIEDGTEDVLLGAAQQRAMDLRPAQGQHGVYWGGYITVSARSAQELADASTSIARIANNDMGIEWLDWQDTYQSFASGYTWPLGRGQEPTPNALTDTMMRGLQGRAPKEALT